jgi:membrane fusion protein (multidrug efflux system)
MDNQTTPTTAPIVVPDRVSSAKVIKWAVAAAVLVAIVAAGIYFWHQSQLYVSTDNSYVNANRIEMAAQVSGPVTAIRVQDQQEIKQGEVLFEIDPQTYQLAVDAAEAQLDLAYQAS